MFASGRGQQDQGQVLVVFALTITSMLAVLGLLYTFGMVLAQRRMLQTAADAAALAGTWSMLSELQQETRSGSVVQNQLVAYAAYGGFVDLTTVPPVYVDVTGSSLGPVVGGTVFLPLARGVRVTLTSTFTTLLPAFVGVPSVLLQSSATALLSPTAPPAAAVLVVPVAVKLQDFQAAYTAHQQYDLFQPTSPPTASLQDAMRWPTLNFLDPTTNPPIAATSYGALSTSLQFWSDGQHANGTLVPNSGVALANNKYFDSISAGLSDNTHRQHPSGNASALILVPIWDTETLGSTTGGGTIVVADTVHVVGFAQMLIQASALSATSAKGYFVPFATSPGTITTASGVDLGAVLVLITS